MRRDDSDRLEAVWGDDWVLSLLETDKDAFAKTGALIVKAYLAGRCRDDACPLHGAAAPGPVGG